MVFLSFASACDRVPLLAPTGTVINLFPAATNVPLNGQIDIVVTVIENGTTTTTPSTGGGTGTTPTTTTSAGAGTPVQNGTLVSFTATIGRIEPSEARTNNGEVRVKFIAGNVSGAATITAHSGGASGKIENLLVGSAAAKRVVVTANPQSLPSTGGSTEVIARVEDDAGTALPGVPVTFTTTAGSLSPTATNTDSTGLARTTLTSTAQADVTAVAGAQSGKVTVVVRARVDIGVVAVPNPATTGSPTVFTITIAGAGANILQSGIDFGDGQNQPLGQLTSGRTVSHAYSSPGVFTATVTSTDASGERPTGATTVVVGALGVTISAANSTVGIPVTFTANLSAATPVSRFVWTIDDGTVEATTGAQFTHVFLTRGTKNIRVDVFGINGQIIGTGKTAINIS